MIRRQTGTMFWNVLSVAMPLCLVFVWVCRRVQTCFEFVNCLHVEYPQLKVFVSFVFDPHPICIISALPNLGGAHPPVVRLPHARAHQQDPTQTR